MQNTLSKLRGPSSASISLNKSGLHSFRVEMRGACQFASAKVGISLRTLWDIESWIASSKQKSFELSKYKQQSRHPINSNFRRSIQFQFTERSRSNPRRDTYSHYFKADSNVQICPGFPVSYLESRICAMDTNFSGDARHEKKAHSIVWEVVIPTQGRMLVSKYLDAM